MENGKTKEKKGKIPYLAFLILTLCFVLGVSFLAFSGCAGLGDASAEEYFSLGMAYYDMGKFEEAERWLNRAKTKDKTKSASEYNLGRIAFETGRYKDAAKHFESILKRDPENVLALKAAAYTRIRLGDFEKAEAHYRKLLVLVPESADDGYNHALVLFAIKKFPEAEQVLMNHEFALFDNYEVLLLYARCQKEQNKPEAIDTYAKWLADNSDPNVRFEYAQILENHELYARALNEYRTVLTAPGSEITRQEVRFSIARLLLFADAESTEGVGELQEAVNEGFDDIEAMEKLLENEWISNANKDVIRTIITDVKQQAAALAAEEAKAGRPSRRVRGRAGRNTEQEE